MNLENEKTGAGNREEEIKKEEERLAALYGPPSLRDEMASRQRNEQTVIGARFEEEDDDEHTIPNGQISYLSFEYQESLDSEDEERAPETVIIGKEEEKAKPRPTFGEEVNEAEEPETGKGFLSLLLTIFSPILMPLYIIILILELSMLTIAGTATKISFILIVFGICTLLPTLLILVLKRAGYIKNLRITDRKERTLPYSFMFFALGGTALFLAVKGFPSWAWFIYIGGATSVLLNLVINFRWKISSSATAMAALVATMIVIQNSGLPPHDMMWWEIGTILLAGLIGTCSLMERTHSLAQVLAGYATGFLPIILYTL